MTKYLIAAGICVLYYLIIVIYAGISADFAWIWLVAAIAFIIFGKICPPILCVGIAVVLLLSTVVLRGMFSKPKQGLRYVIVLGAQVKGEKPSRALLKRLKAAEKYVQTNPNTILVLSGGKGSGEDITEAECMRIWLTEHGISEERLILEDTSTNTRENLKFSSDLCSCKEADTGILSNDFHISRAVMLAKRLGYTEVHGIPAEGDPVMELHYIVRETAALIKEYLFI